MRVHPHVTGQVRRHRSWRAALASTDAVADGTAAFEEPALLQLLDVWPPGIVVADGIVVHQKDVFGHCDLPIPLRLRSKHCSLAPPRTFNGISAITVPASLAHGTSTPRALSRSRATACAHAPLLYFCG